MGNDNAADLLLGIVAPTSLPELQRVPPESLNLLKNIPSIDLDVDPQGKYREQAIHKLLATINTGGMTKKEIADKLDRRSPLRKYKSPSQYKTDEFLTVSLMGFAQSTDPIERKESVELLVQNAQNNLNLALKHREEGVYTEAQAATQRPIGKAHLGASAHQWYEHEGRMKWALESLCAAAYIHNQLTYPQSLPLAK